jgi:hypothetical protein
MKEALSSSETSVLTRATRRNIPQDTILQDQVSWNSWLFHFSVFSSHISLRPKGSHQHFRPVSPIFDLSLRWQTHFHIHSKEQVNVYVSTFEFSIMAVNIISYYLRVLPLLI